MLICRQTAKMRTREGKILTRNEYEDEKDTDEGGYEYGKDAGGKGTDE